jgi:RNA polymerase sigma-70 factor (ECF subfamily)
MSLQMTLEPKPTISVVQERRADRDRELVEALRLRETTAVERLVATYGDRAYRLARGITGNAEDAEEVVQDVFWTVVRKVDTFRGESAFGSWFYRIVANAAYQKVRGRQSRRAELSLDDVLPLFDERGRHVAPVADWSARVEDHAVQTELRMALTSAIDKLPADYRTALLLRDVEGLSHLQMAEVLCLSGRTVKSRVHRARLFLRKQLGDTLATLDAPIATAGTRPWPVGEGRRDLSCEPRL